MKLYKSGIKNIALVRPKDVTVSIYGLGKMGLPLAAVFASKGFHVIGVDTNEEVVKKVNAGKNPIIGEECLDALVKKIVAKKTLRASTDGVLASRESDIKIIIVPTFLDKHNKPDLEIVKDVCKKIADRTEKRRPCHIGEHRSTKNDTGCHCCDIGKKKWPQIE